MIYSSKECEAIRRTGEVVARVFREVERHVCPGKTPMELDVICCKEIERTHQAKSQLASISGFPASITASVNQHVCNTVPNNVALVEGDIISLHVGVVFNGFHSGASRTFPVGQISPESQHLIDTANSCLEKAVGIIKPGVRLGDIGWAIESTAKIEKYSVVQEYCGYGTGSQLHQDPQVLNYGRKNSGVEVKAGMVLVIIPMLNAGARHVKFDKKTGWGCYTVDGSNSASFGDTVVITETGCEIVTR